MTPGNVLIWSGEDNPADTIKPRMMAANADGKRYAMIDGTIDESGQNRSFDPSRDIEDLRRAVEEFGGVSLLVIDPIVSAVSGDMHRANDVRRSLQPIVDFAEEMNCAVLGITHFPKGTAGSKAAERVIGSQAFTALARMVLVAQKDENSDRRVIARAKSNTSIDTGGFAYEIEQVALHRGITTVRVVWRQVLHGNARDILASVEAEGVSEDGTKISAAKSFLVSALANGPVESKELIETAREAHDISKDTLKRAKTDLNIVSRKSGMNGAWVWSFPFNTSGFGKTQ